MLRQLKKTNWMMKKPLENNPFANYGLSIKEGANNIKEAIDALNSLPTVNNNAQAAIESLKALGEIDTGDDINIGIDTPFFKAVLSWKEASMESFAADLSKSVENIQGFVTGIKDIEFTYDKNGKLKAVTLAEMLSAMANVPVPPSGGFVAWIKNYEGAITQFSTDLATAMPWIASFVSQANNDVEDPDIDKLTSIIGIIKDLASITMPENDGNVVTTVAKLVDEYNTSLSQIRKLANSLKTEYAADLDVVERFTNLFTIFSKSYEFDLGKLDELPKKLNQLVSDINKELGGSSIDQNLAIGLKGIADLMTGNYIVTGFTESATDITSGITKLASIAGDNGNNEIANAKETVTTFTDFVNKLLYLQNVFKVDKFKANADSAIEVLNGMFSQFDNNGANGLKVRQLTSFFNAIEKLYELNFSYEGGEPVPANKLATAFAVLSDSIDKFKPDVELSDLQSYTSWIESLSGQKETFEKAGEALSAFVVDPNKLASVTSFIEALKGEFHFSPGKTINKEVHSWTDGPNIVEEEIEGYFSKIAQDLVDAGKILNGKEADFSGFDTVKNKLTSFTVALSGLMNKDMGSVKDKLIEFISGVNAAINGEGEHEGVGNYKDKLSQFDALAEIFGSLDEYANRGLKDVIPDILNGISDAVNNFAPTPAGMQKLKETVDQIAETLSVLYPYWGMYENGGPDLSVLNGKGPKGSMASSGSGQGRNRAGKFSEFLEKRQKAESSTENGMTDFVSSINNAELDEEKANLLVEVANNISEAAENVVEIDADSFSGFVQSIADSISQNSESTNLAAQEVAEAMIEVLKGFESEFVAVGAMFNRAIGDGLLSVTDAQSSAAVLAGEIMESLSSAISGMAGEKSAGIVQSIADALGSEESKSAVDAALNALFGQTSEDTGGLDIGQDMPVTDMSSATGIGYKFAQQFIEDFQEGLNDSSEQFSRSRKSL